MVGRCGYFEYKQRRFKEFDEILKKPFGSEMIQEVIKQKHFDLFHRSKEVQEKYDSEKEKAIKKLEKELKESVKKSSKKRWVLRKNDYPYHFEKGLEHWVLWDTHDDKNWEKMTKDFKRWKIDNAYWFKDVVAEWINPPQFRSVDIPHVHLVFKSKKTIGQLDKFRISKKEAKNREDAVLCDSCDRYFVSCYVTKKKNGHNYCEGCKRIGFDAKKYKPVNQEEFNNFLRAALNTPPITNKEISIRAKRERQYKAGVKIIKKIIDAGHEAYFVGGWVRDSLLDISSDDIDITTSCPIERIFELFSNVKLTGRNFGVIMVKIKTRWDEFWFDVATYRKDGDYKDSRYPINYVETTAWEDAKRRDFTVNAFYFTPKGTCICQTYENKNDIPEHKCSLEKPIYRDWVKGTKDLKDKLIRAISDPYERFEEDPLRMIRAVRFAVKLDFTIEEETKKAIKKMSNQLFPKVSEERIWLELEKIDKGNKLNESLFVFYELGLLEEILSKLEKNNNLSEERVFLRKRIMESYKKNNRYSKFQN